MRYVAKRISMFAWSAVDDVELATQYLTLLRHWKALLQKPLPCAKLPVHEAGIL